MRDELCVYFLQWCLPRLEMRWAGFRKVRGQVCKRIARRMHELDLNSTGAYRAYLKEHGQEWAVLDELCRITISRFYRDRGVFDTLRLDLLAGLAARAQKRCFGTVRAWSAGCASGEEPYTLRLVWDLDVQKDFPQIDLLITATDADGHMLARARRARYSAGTLKNLPDTWTARGFEMLDEEEPFRLRSSFRRGIEWDQQDIREEMPGGTFDLICCRNLVFMYFDEPMQRTCLQRINQRLRRGGLLILGKHEKLPEGSPGFAPVDQHQRIYRKL